MTSFAPPRPAEAPRRRRAGAWAARAASAAVLACSMSVLGVAARLTPSSTGVGTHEQLGLAACGFLRTTGYPCGTCGMTTAFAYAAHGRLLASVHAQPFGAVLAVLTAAAALISAYTLASGHSLGPLLSWLWRPPLLGFAVAAFLAAWGYKTLLVRGYL